MSKDYGANQNTVQKNKVKSQEDHKDMDILEAKDAHEPQNNAPSAQFRCSIMQSPPGRVRTRGGMSQTSSPRKPKWNEDEKEVDVNRLDVEPKDEQNPPNNVPSNQSSIGSIAQSPRGRVRTRGGTSQTSSPRKPKWDGDITNLNVTTLDFLDVIVLADQNEVINIESIDISNSSKHAPDDVSLEFYPVEVFDVTEVEESNSSTQTISQVQSPNSMVQYDSESDTWVCGNNPVEFIVQEDINNVIKLNAADAQEEQNGCPSTSPTAFAASSEHLECANTRTSVLTKILEQIPEKDLKNSPRTPAKTPKGDHSSIRYLKSGRNLPLKKRVRFEDCVENKTIASTKPPERPRRCPQRSHPRPSGVRHLELSKTFQPRTPPKPPVNSFNSELIKCIQNCSSTPKKTHEQNPNDEKPKRSPANTPMKKCGKSPRCVKMNDDGVRSLTSSILKSPEKFSTSSLLKTLSKCLKLAKASGEKPSGFRPRQLLWDRNEDTERKVPDGLNDSERNAVTELELMPKNDGSNSLTEDRASISSTQTISPVQSPNSNESTLGYDGESYTWITSTPTKSPHSEFVKNSTTPRDKTPGQISNSEKSKGIVTSTALNKVVKCPERVQVRDDNQESLPGSALTLPAQSPGDVTNLISEECSTSSSLKEPALRLHRAKAKEKKQRFGFRQGHLLEDKIKYLKNILRDGELDDRLGSNSSELNAVKEIEGMPVADGNNTFMKNHESSASTTSILPEHTSQHEQILGEILGSLSEPTQNAKNMENIHYGSESEDSDSDEEELVPMIVPRAYRVGLNDSFQDDDEKLDLPAAPAMDVGSPAVALAKDLEGTLRPNDLFHFEWRPFPDPPIPPNTRREPFTQSIVGPTKPCQDPYTIFASIWDTQIMEHIVTETNNYAQSIVLQRMRDNSLCPRSRILGWEDTCVSELYTYFGITLATGIVIKSKLEDYWSANNDIFSTPGFRAYMSLTRYQLLTSCLHFNNNQKMRGRDLSPAEAKLFKIEPILNHLNSKFQSMYTMGRNIALDESLMQWKGWLSINQFIPNKKGKIGVKTYELCESQTGYLWRFEVHAKKYTPHAQQSPLDASTPTIVLNLLRGLEGKGYTVWMDNFYNSPALARQLKILGFDSVGTLRTNRRFVPQEMKNLTKANMSKGQITGLTSGDVDIMVWHDETLVGTISTYHGNQTDEIDNKLKPCLILDYNIMMGGIDKKDQLLSMYPIERKRCKVWYKKFFKRLLNVSVLNSFIIAKQSGSTISHRNFRKNLIQSLLTRHGTEKSTPQTYSLQINTQNTSCVIHHPLHYPKGKCKARLRRKCFVCKKLTNYYCAGCEKTVCMNICFVTLHS